MNEKIFIDKTNGKLTEIMKFASTHPKGSTLDNCFKTLERLCNSEKGQIVELYQDWSRLGLCFSIIHPEEDIHGLSGGIIYHGLIDGKPISNGSITVDPSKGWQVHT